MAAFTAARDKSQWHWTAMIMTPDWVPSAMVADAAALVGKKTPPARLGDVRLELLEEGLCVQALHIGPYDDEEAVLAEMHERFLSLIHISEPRD